MVTLVAFEAWHVRLALLPNTIEAGLATNEMISGSGGKVTTTFVAAAEAVVPAMPLAMH
jgi:hypothetical protein